MAPRTLEQFQVGETFSLERECDRYRPIFYAAASGDFNPIHIDAEVGEAAGLGGVILQGLCTMAWAAEAAVRLYGDPTRLKKLSVRFSRPVKPGDTLTFRGSVTAIDGTKVSAQLSAVNQNGEDVLKNGQAEGEVAR
jgi:3-hydroxybutyryl-CoA dehydratase